MRINVKYVLLWKYNFYNYQIFIKVSLEFVQYKSRTVGKPSGAYLFYPLGPASPLFSRQPIVRVIRGPISSEIQAQFPSILHR